MNMKNISVIILSIIPALAHASDMGGLAFFISIPISFFCLVFAFLIGLFSKSGQGFIGLGLCAIVSCILGLQVLAGFTYQESGALYIIQAALLLLLVFPFIVLHSSINKQ
ncbi:Uncharacterised protein [BD1-7 clade bacterium]|uniref:Uncharacterized protein n=1 Tax=BD1-7 clade bacterium TaxID=2029982 RepID=A0A5S9QP95_9GAMM|nr:Uncharacterised protein [BD1-7 clade bacterium]